MSSEHPKKKGPCASTPNKMDGLPLHAIEVSALRSSPSTGAQTQKATPNIDRRRAPPNLTRRTPRSSHYAHISAIFDDAGRTVSHVSTPRLLSVPAKKLPLLSTKSHAPFNGTGAPQMSSWMAASPGAEPTSSGYGSPISKKIPNPPFGVDEIVYPDLTELSSSVVRRHFTAVTHTPTCESELCSAIPGIQNWLDDMHDHGPLDRSPQTSLPATPSPSKIPVASVQDGDINVQCSSAERSCPVLTRSARRLISRGCLTSPPKRKRARLSPIRKSQVDGDQDFIIYEDETSENHVELSPSVEQFRKGRRPPRESSGSYWDKDILPGLKDLSRSMEEMGEEKDGRQVLGDLPSLTKTKGFVEGVENAKFDFSA
ncbi:MAG: hypothetical protein LQ346_008224 [Caloplaca aetnensis]|nr:MAG: hypothetical protein LQ346_008224 [Caloplaca aetnensis]